MDRQEFKQKIIGLNFYYTYTSFGSDDNERTMVFRPKIDNYIDVVIECSIYGITMFKDNSIHMEVSDESMYDDVYNVVKLLVRDSRIKKILNDGDDD